MQKSSDEKKKRSFLTEYERLTMLQNSCPLSHVLSRIKENVLDVNADRIISNEWDPIFGALKVDTSLEFVAFRSHWQPENTTTKGLKAKKKPPIRSRGLTIQLSSSLKDCLAGSRCLECLVLQNLPLREHDVRLLREGIESAHCLKYLSFERSRIGDKYLAVLQETLKKSTTLVTINLTACRLTSQSAVALADVVKQQAAQRNGEAWKASLRYRQPNFDQMQGLRRLTLCENNIGDEGARIFADAIKDDFWLKALDLQKCGISSEGAGILKDALKFNKTLVVLDLRRNLLVDHTVLRSTIETVMVNAGGEHTDFPWLSVRDLDSERKKNSICKFRSRNGIRRNCTRRKSIDDRVPWRTAERMKLRYNHGNKVNKRKACLPKHEEIPQQIDTYNETAVQKAKYSLHNFRKSDSIYNRDQKGLDNPSFKTITENRVNSIPTHYSLRKSVKHKGKINAVEDDIALEELDHPNTNESKKNYLRVIDELQLEIEIHRESFLREREKRLDVERRLSDLEKENKILADKVKFYRDNKQKPKFDVSFQAPDLRVDGNLLEDEHVLGSIENSFQQFQQFLDMLKDLGLGDVICNQLTNPPAHPPT